MMFANTNLETASLEEVQTVEIEYVIFALDELKKAQRLCGKIGKDIINQYQFRGTFDDVYKALEKYLNDLAQEFTESDRNNVINAKNRFEEFEETNNSYLKERIKEVFLERDLNGGIMTEEMITKQLDAISDSYELNEIAHDNKMCLCYQNV